MNRKLERREIGLFPLGDGKLQHAAEHRRHELAVRHAVLLNQLQVFERIESLHDDRCAALTNREVDRGLRCRVVERCGRQIDHPIAVLPEVGEEVEDRQILRRSLLRQRPDNPLRLTCGTRRVEHRRAEQFVVNRRSRLIRDRCGVVPNTLVGPCRRTADHEDQGHVVERRHRFDDERKLR